MDLNILDFLQNGLFDRLSILGLYIGMTIILLISFEVGYQLCKYTSGNDKGAINSTGPMVGGLLGMLAFVLAFTFSMASSQHNLRKQHLLDEANIIGTAYLRADLIDNTHGTKIKNLLKEYVNGRVNAVKSGDPILIKKAIIRSQEIHDLLWTEITSVAKQESTITIGLLIQSINDLIDSNQNRITAGFYNRIPSTIWFVLLIISALTMMTIGAQAKLAKSRGLVAVIPMIMAFTALTTIVIDLDRPQRGMIKVGQEALIDLQKTINRELPE